MSSASVAQRLIRAVGESSAAEQVADAQVRIYRPLIGWARRSWFHTNAFGHSVHPPLTDITIGCWLSTSLLDALGGRQSRRAATTLAGLGLVASVPTAIAGAADWSELTGEERRIIAVHSLGTDIATFLFLGSFIARARRRHNAGVKLALAGNTALLAAGFLGGHVALTRGTANRTAHRNPQFSAES